MNSMLTQLLDLWLLEPHAYVGIDRTPDPRLAVYDVETGNIVAMCTNEESLQAAVRLLSIGG